MLTALHFRIEIVSVHKIKSLVNPLAGLSWLLVSLLHSKNTALVVDQLKELVDRLCDLCNVERCSCVQN